MLWMTTVDVVGGSFSLTLLGRVAYTATVVLIAVLSSSGFAAPVMSVRWLEQHPQRDIPELD